MISPISFTSTYKVSSRHNNFNQFTAFQNIAQDEEIEHCAKMSIKFKPSKEYTNRFETECTLNVPDYRDASIEDYCNQYGITFKKIDSKAISSDSLENRIYEPEDIGVRLVKVDSDKLKELIDKQSSNIEDCKQEYEKRFKDSVDFIFKSVDKFLTTKVIVFSKNGITSDVLKSIKDSNNKNIDNDQLYIYFCNESCEPDQCMYFGFQDLGMKEIPIYTDELSYRILDELGVIKKE